MLLMRLWMDQWAKAFPGEFTFFIISLASLSNQMLTHPSLQATLAAIKITKASATVETSIFFLKTKTPHIILCQFLATIATGAIPSRIAASVLILIIPLEALPIQGRHGEYEAYEANSPPSSQQTHRAC